MKINRVSVVDEVVKYLKSKLMSGEWKPGEKITAEVTLSKQLNVSRASVHSAIQQLVAVGVLEGHQGKGTFVKSISLMELQNRLNDTFDSGSTRKMVEFRVILEGEICRSLAPVITKDTLDQLYGYIEKIKENKADPQLTSHYDFEFHRCLYLATHNEFIIQSLSVICGELQRAHLANYNERTIASTIAEHTRVADCLRDGDGDGARRNMIFHLAGVRLDPPFDLSSTKALEASLFNPVLFSKKKAHSKGEKK